MTGRGPDGPPRPDPRTPRPSGKPELPEASAIPGTSGAAGTSFVGSFVEDHESAEIVLRGDVDAAVAARVRVHIDTLRAAGIRFLTIDATAVDRFDETLIDLIGFAQRQLGTRRGMIQVRGLSASTRGPDRRTDRPPAPGTGHPAGD